MDKFDSNLVLVNVIKLKTLLVFGWWSTNHRLSKTNILERIEKCWFDDKEEEQWWRTNLHGTNWVDWWRIHDESRHVFYEGGCGWHLFGSNAR